MSMLQEDRSRSWSARVPAGIAVVGTVLAVMWVLELVDSATGGRLDAYGIRPHTLDGLEGIPVSPFLHAGFAHLVSNSVVLAVLGVVAYAAVTLGRFLALIAITTLSSGLGAWAFGTPGSVVVGASGVIFGLLGFLLLRGLVERSPGAITVSVMVLIVYGGTMAGVLPGTLYVSWQSHLFGFLGGAAAAFWLRRRRSAYDVLR
ncbi:rhomboid family intramembrane serine protease [Nocardioides korecus]